MCIICYLGNKNIHSNIGTISQESIDALASTSTTYSLSPGDSFSGILNSNGDRDWVAINLNESERYTFDLTGSVSGDGNLTDPLLRLYDSNGVLLAEDDDGGDGYESRLTYTALSSSTFYLSAGSYDDSYTGSYLLSTSVYDNPILGTFQESIDAIASTSTTYSLSPGDSFSGILNSNGDRDWVAINLNESERYTFDLTGSVSGDGSLTDPLLRLYDSNGVLLAEDDDGGDGYESRLTYMALSSSTFYLSAGSYDDSYTGSYLLSTTSSTDTSPSIRNFGSFLQNSDIESSTWSEIDSNNPYIQGLMWGCKWGNVDPVNLTTELNYYIYDNETTIGGYTAGELLEEEQAAYIAAMEAYSSVANLTFTQGVSDSESHILWTSLNSQESGGSRVFGWAAPPDVTGSYTNSYGEPPGLTTQNWNQYSSNNNIDDPNILLPGSYFYLTTIHELGHSLGLAHPHDNLAVFPGVSNSSDGGDKGLNATPFTVMTYNDIGANSYVPESYSYSGYLETLGAFDIASIQYLYGPNINQNTEDNIYFLNESELNGWQCIWDNGGTDTISAESALKSVSIDLRNATLQNNVGGGGYVSQIGKDSLGITIAFNSTGNCIIENAIGSMLNDTLRGNLSSNSLMGNEGKDYLYGMNGDDLLDGGTGIDIMYGGAGNDTYIVDESSDVVREGSDQGTDLVKSSVTYRIRNSNVENLTLNGNGDINGNGNSSDNVLTGNSGANKLKGGAGDDVIDGGNGIDKLFGNPGNDLLFGDSGNDRLFGGDGNDQLTGGLGNDQLTGGLGNDIFHMNTGTGKDTIKDYGTGNDRIQLLGGLTESDLTLKQVGDDSRIKYGDDLMAIVRDTMIADLTFI